jgi:riboflavin synthase
LFTGIIEEVGSISEVRENGFSFAGDVALEGVVIGDSIAVNGACLTVTSLNEREFTADVMPETLRKTNLASLKEGDPVNLERPLALGSRLGGHIMQGHIDGQGTVVSVEAEGDAMIMEVEAPPELMPYIVTKGFIGLDGISLTVVERKASSFTVSLVNFTWQHTNLSVKGPGSPINLEVDILAKYVEQLVKGDNSPVYLESLALEGGKSKT